MVRFKYNSHIYWHILWQHSWTESDTGCRVPITEAINNKYHRNLVDQLYCDSSGVFPVCPVAIDRNLFPDKEPCLLACNRKFS